MNRWQKPLILKLLNQEFQPSVEKRLMKMLTIWCSQLWCPVNFKPNRRSLSKPGNKNQILYKTQFVLNTIWESLSIPYRTNVFLKTNTNPLCAYLTTCRLGPLPVRNLNTRVYKAGFNYREINHTNIWNDSFISKWITFQIFVLRCEVVINRHNKILS